MNTLIPIWMDPEIIDMTRLVIWFGNLKKSFENYEEMAGWKKKADKLNPGWEDKKC